MIEASALVPTARPERYLKQLVGHFSTKLETTIADGRGEIRFGVGTCRLLAVEGGLHLDASAATAVDLATLEQVVASHLVRFGTKDELTVSWSDAAA